MQCSNTRLLSSGGFGHLDLNFNNSVFIAQLKACSRVWKLYLLLRPVKTC